MSVAVPEAHIHVVSTAGSQWVARGWTATLAFVVTRNTLSFSFALSYCVSA